MRTPCSTLRSEPCAAGSDPPADCSVAVRSGPACVLPCAPRAARPSACRAQESGVRRQVLHAVTARSRAKQARGRGSWARLGYRVTWLELLGLKPLAASCCSFAARIGAGSEAGSLKLKCARGCRSCARRRRSERWMLRWPLACRRGMHMEPSHKCALKLAQRLWAYSATWAQTCLPRRRAGHRQRRARARECTTAGVMRALGSSQGTEPSH